MAGPSKKENCCNSNANLECASSNCSMCNPACVQKLNMQPRSLHSGLVLIGHIARSLCPRYGMSVSATVTITHARDWNIWQMARELGSQQANHTSMYLFFYPLIRVSNQEIGNMKKNNRPCKSMCLTALSVLKTTIYMHYNKTKKVTRADLTSRH